MPLHVEEHGSSHAPGIVLLHGAEGRVGRVYVKVSLGEPFLGKPT